MRPRVLLTVTLGSALVLAAIAWSRRPIRAERGDVTRALLEKTISGY